MDELSFSAAAEAEGRLNESGGNVIGRIMMDQSRNFSLGDE